MDRLDSRATDRLSGPAWEALRPKFERIHSALISAAPDATGQLTTIYVKYATPETGQKPFAVVWIKNSTEIVVGLALPPSKIPRGLSGPPPGFKYAGLTGYFRVKSTGFVPAGISKWAATAYSFAKEN